MPNFSEESQKHPVRSSMLTRLARATSVACALTLSMMTLSCAPGSRIVAASYPQRQASSIIDSVVWSLVGDGQAAKTDPGLTTGAPKSVASTPAAMGAGPISDAPEASADEVFHTAEYDEAEPADLGAAQPAEADVQPAASVPASPEEPMGARQSDEDEQSIRFDWTSVDTYHQNPPLWNALGRFEERWYAAHNFTQTGAGIASLAEGDLLRVDGVTLEVSWIYDGSYESTYDEVRSIVGEESYCFQTCTGVGTGIIVVVCYPV